MTDVHGVDPNQEIGWIPTMKLSGSRSGNQVAPFGEIGWIPKRKFCILRYPMRQKTRSTRRLPAMGAADTLYDNARTEFGFRPQAHRGIYDQSSGSGVVVKMGKGGNQRRTIASYFLFFLDNISS